MCEAYQRSRRRHLVGMRIFSSKPKAYRRVDFLSAVGIFLSFSAAGTASFLLFIIFSPILLKKCLLFTSCHPFGRYRASRKNFAYLPETKIRDAGRYLLCLKKHLHIRTQRGNV